MAGGGLVSVGSHIKTPQPSLSLGGNPPGSGLAHLAASDVGLSCLESRLKMTDEMSMMAAGAIGVGIGIAVVVVVNLIAFAIYWWLDNMPDTRGMR